MYSLPHSVMRIAHIAASDLTAARRGQMLAMAELFRKLDFIQIVIATPETGLDADLRAIDVECRPHAFGRLFDLKAERAVNATLTAFAPHILQSHSPIAARFACDHLRAFAPVHAAFADAMPTSGTPALRLYQDKDQAASGHDGAVAVPPLSGDAPDAVKSYLLAYRTLMTDAV